MKKIVKEWLSSISLPSAARDERRRDRRELAEADPGAEKAIAAGVAWLGHAQDFSRTRDGGVARHFSLIDGWAASYPETTGYIVATLLAHGRDHNDTGAIARARKMLDWLLAIQFPEGGFQGGMVDQLPRVPVTFNTGQILIGLAAGAHLDMRYRDAMLKAADWLVATQDADGCWRKNPTPFAKPGEKTYETHVALGLFHAHDVDKSRGYQAAALRQVDWALQNQTSNGWLSNCCLSDPVRPLTHTLGYALRGIVGAFLSSRQPQYYVAACKTADGLMGAISGDGRLAGRLDANWRAAVDWVCLTGACQIAESLFLLRREGARADYARAATSLNAFVRRTIKLEGSGNIIGGVKGSFPVDGDYGRWQYLNWACKFMIDSNRAELLDDSSS